jgi:hypothetical protein
MQLGRFERWCTSVQYTPLSQFVNENLPPIDVIMVHHAYLLNPGYVHLADQVSAAAHRNTVGTRKTRPDFPSFETCRG